VNYEVSSQRTLVRNAGNAECGPKRALSNDVIELKPVEGGVEVVLEFAYRPGKKLNCMDLPDQALCEFGP
jgi:hypothetical protein